MTGAHRLLWALIAAMAIGGCAPPPQPQAAPELSLETLDGTRIELGPTRGAPTLLLFFAINNPLALDELSRLEPLADEFSDLGLELVAVARSDERPELVRTIIHQQGYLFPVALDPTDAAATAFGVTSTPTTILLSAGGNPVYSVAGINDLKALRAKMTAD